MAKSEQPRHNGINLVLKVAGLFIAVGGLSLGFSTFATSGLSKQITTLSGDVTNLRERTTVVETRQPDIRDDVKTLVKSVGELQITVNKILERLPARAVSSPAGER